MGVQDGLYELLEEVELLKFLASPKVFLEAFRRRCLVL